MPKYIAFLVPDKAWDGIDYLYELIELRPNNLNFALVTAKNMEQARKKYFLDYLYLDCFCENFIRIDMAADCLEHIFESYNKQEIINYFGETDGKTIWQLAVDTPDDLPISHTDAEKTAKLLSADSIATLCFLTYEYKIAVSKIEKNIN